MKFPAIVFAAAAFALTAPLPSSAADYPTKPVEIINPANPGGGSDRFSRMLAAVSAEHFGGDFVILSKPGGRGVVSMNYAKNRPADGYTLMIFTPGQLQIIAEGKAPFKLEDVEPVIVGTVDPVVLVSKAGTFKNVQDLIAQGKKRRIKVGGTMTGGFEWLAAMAFANEAGLQKPIYVPLGGGGDVILNTIGGTLDIGVANLTEITDQVKSGELDALVLMAEQRSPALPDVPLTKDIGLDLVLSQSRGLVAVKGTPEDRLQKLEQAFLKGMQSEKYQEYLKSSGLGPDSIGGRKEWGKMMQDITKRVVKSFAEMEEQQKGQKK